MNRWRRNSEEDIVIDYDNGLRVSQKWGHKESTGASAVGYSYKADGRDCTFFVPNDIRPRVVDVGLAFDSFVKEYHRYRLRAGRVQATPWDIEEKTDLSRDEISRLCLGHAIQDGYKSFSGGGFDMKILIAVALIAGVVFLGYQFMNKGNTPVVVDNVTPVVEVQP